MSSASAARTSSGADVLVEAPLAERAASFAAVAGAEIGRDQQLLQLLERRRRRAGAW